MLYTDNGVKKNGNFFRGFVLLLTQACTLISDDSNDGVEPTSGFFIPKQSDLVFLVAFNSWGT